MKSILLLLIIVLLCSFKGEKNNSLSDQGMKGKVKRVTYYSCWESDYATGKEIYTYDEMGNEISDKGYAADGKDSESTVWDYKYNGDSNKIEENLYKNDGSLSWKTIFTYDKDGNVTETNRYYGNKHLMERVVLKHDINGNITSAISYDSAAMVNYKITTIYDEKNNPVLRVNKNEMPEWKEADTTMWQYNGKGDLIEMQYIQHPEKYPVSIVHIFNYAYTKFDSFGNWLNRSEKLTFGGKEDRTIITKRREIIYY